MSGKLEDLLTNLNFRKCILNPNQGDTECWERWKESEEENQRIAEEAKNIILDFYDPLSPEEFESEAIEFRRKINVTSSEKKDIISLYEQRRPRHNKWLKYAAAIAFFLISTFLVLTFTGLFQFSEEKTLDTSQIITKETHKGQKMTIVFKDGSVVKLNSESKISYPIEFNQNKREVTLAGEAFFEVAHHEHWPFIVKTNEIYTEVLGTSFNINSYSDKDFVSIALVDGSVSVKSDKRTFQLKPMEMVTISDSNGTSEIKNFDLKNITGWKDNIIVFEKASFSEFESTLERWFDIEIVYDEAPVFEGGYTGDFTNQSLELILEGVSTNRFEYKWENKKLLRITKTKSL